MIDRLPFLRAAIGDFRLLFVDKRQDFGAAGIVFQE
jgi:hypothetical protein